MSPNTLKSIAVEIIGWLLVLIGLAALVLPGPGLLALFAGLTLLATKYDWAERRLKPVRIAALKTARDSVASWQRIAASLLGIAMIAMLGVLWLMQPAAPMWWPIADNYWLIGGSGTGITLLLSSIIAGGMLIYSYAALRSK